MNEEAKIEFLSGVIRAMVHVNFTEESLRKLAAAAWQEVERWKIAA